MSGKQSKTQESAKEIMSMTDEAFEFRESIWEVQKCHNLGVKKLKKGICPSIDITHYSNKKTGNKQKKEVAVFIVLECMFLFLNNSFLCAEE